MILGNSKGNNKGKKYKKLTGNEIASPEDRMRADQFANWYAQNIDQLTRELISKEMYDYDVMTDTFILMYDNIALKDLLIDSYKSYFYRAYYTNCIHQKTKDKRAQQLLVRIDDPTNFTHLSDEDGDQMTNTTDTTLIASEFDHNLYEQIVDQLHSEVLSYVRTHYNETNATIYEMYVDKDLNCSEIAQFLHVPNKKIFNHLYFIKKDIVNKFGAKKNQLFNMI